MRRRANSIRAAASGRAAVTGRAALTELALLGSLLMAAPACTHASGSTAAKAASAPVDATAFYPLERGWAWAYDVQQGSDRILAITTVVERDGSAAVVKAGEQELRYLIVPEGITRATEPLPFGEPDPAPDFLLRSPLEEGKSWPIPGGTARVAKTGATVTVPAGTFSGCVVVEESREAPRRLVRTVYAPEVGPIAIEYLLHRPEAGEYTTEMRAELRGITRPGDDPLR